MKKSAKGRMPVKESMPALMEACPGFEGFRKGEKRADRIYELLLGVIQQSRAATAKRFYTIREMADFFGVSICTMQVVCQRLNMEGVLTRVRSSQMTIAPRSHRPKFALRGVVCMPIWMPGFLHFLDWRRRFSELETELSRHRFVLEPIFFGHGEEIDPAFVERVLKFNPDYLIWDSPARTDRMTMQSITDAGVPILTILAPPEKPLPGRIYRRSNTQGLLRGLEDWEASSEINRIVMPQAGREHRQDDFLSILQDCSLPHEFKIFDHTNSLSQYLKHLAPNRRTGIIFSDGLFFSQLCALVPEKMFQLFRRHRVMVLHQVTMPSLAMPPDVRVDALLFSNKRLARRIAVDLSQSKGALRSNEEVFEAEWRPRVPLKEIAQISFRE